MTDCPEAFERDTGGTEAEWLRTLPGACGRHPLSLPAPGRAIISIEPGRLCLHWEVLPPRRIALISLPRMRVVYRFEGVGAAQRAAFMRSFDLHLQRGGG